jgi:5-methyltetrahydropteroyltriglutamate--homocysteine methyltransferase
VAEVTELIELVLHGIPEGKAWINPDCGLMTRGYDETVASLENIMEAIRAMRIRVGSAV